MKSIIKAFMALAMAGALAAPARAETVIINNYVQTAAPHRWCWGLIGCLAMHAMNEPRTAPYTCNAWIGRAYVRTTCAP